MCRFIRKRGLRYLKDRLRRRSSASAILLFCLFLGYFLFLLYISQSLKVGVAGDPVVSFFPSAERFLNGAGYHAFTDRRRPAGYPFLVALVTKILGGNIFFAGKLISILSTTLFLFATYLIMATLFDKRIAICTTMLVMTSYLLIYYASSPLTDPLFICLASFSLYFLIRRSSSAWNMILAGVFGGLSLTVRWNGLVLLLFVLIVDIVVSPKRITLKGRLGRVALYSLGFFIAASPWLTVNHLLHGSPFYHKNYINLHSALYPPSAAFERPQNVTEFLAVILSDPIHFFLQYFKQFFARFPIVVRSVIGWEWPYTGSIVGILVPLGFVALLKGIARRRLYFLLFYLIYWASLAWAEFRYEGQFLRFYLLTIPVFALFAVSFLFSKYIPDVWIRLRSKKLEEISVRTTVVALVLLASIVSTGISIKARHIGWSKRFSSQLEVANFLQKIKGESDIAGIGVLPYSRARYTIPYQTGIRIITYDDDNYASILPKISHLFYDVALYGRQPGGLANLDAPGNLEAVYFRTDPVSVVLYHVLEENHLSNVVKVVVSPSSNMNPVKMIDGDMNTQWISDSSYSAANSHEILFELGYQRKINRIWILPLENGNGFPSDFQIESSSDGGIWSNLVTEHNYPRPLNQNPQIFSFPEVEARFVKFVASRLRKANDTDRYSLGFAEVRISLAKDKKRGLSDFGLSAADVNYEPERASITAELYNLGDEASSINVRFAWGRGIMSEIIKEVEAPIIPPGESGQVRVRPEELRLGRDLCVTVDEYNVTKRGKQNICKTFTLPIVLLAVNGIEYTGGVLYGPARWEKTELGTIFQFNGSDDYISIPDDNRLDITDEFTVAAWIRIPSGNTDTLTIVSKGSSTTGYTLATTGVNSKLSFFGKDISVKSDTFPSIADSRWHHVAVTYDGNHIRFFLDGDNIGTIEKTFTLQVNDAPLAIGKYLGNAPPTFFKGNIAEVLIYNDVLTVDEIIKRGRLWHQWPVQDPRVQAAEWMKSNIPKGSKVALIKELGWQLRYYFEEGDFQVLSVGQLEKPLHWYVENAIDYIVTSRHFASSSENDQMEKFNTYFWLAPVIKKFGSKAMNLFTFSSDPEIVILKVTPDFGKLPVIDTPLGVKYLNPKDFAKPQRTIVESHAIMFQEGTYTIDIIAKAGASSSKVSPPLILSVFDNTSSGLIAKERFEMSSRQYDVYSTKQIELHAPRLVFLQLSANVANANNEAERLMAVGGIHIKKVIIRKIPEAGGYFDGFTLFSQWQSDRLTLVIEQGTRRIGLLSDRGLITGKEWHHVAVTFGMDYKVKFYIDGELAGTDTISLRPFVRTSSLMLGAYVENGKPQFHFTGVMNDVRVYNKALGEFEIEQLFRQGWETEEATEQSELDLVKYWIFGEGGVQTSSIRLGDNNVILHGDWLKTTEFGVGFEFDGVDDYIQIFDSDSLDTITDEFTISAWVKLDGVAIGRQVLVSTENLGKVLK